MGGAGTARDGGGAPADLGDAARPADGGTGGELPFTGLALAILALAGVAIAATGVLVRRTSRPPA